MKTTDQTMRGIITENKSVIAAGVALTLALSAYFILWHCTIIAFGSIYSVHDLLGKFLGLTASYLVFSTIVSSIICGLLIAAKKPFTRKFIVGASLFLFFSSEFIRMFDWGALYFGGNHVDTNFWAHAFYADGTVYLATWLSLGLYVTVALFFALLFVIMRKLYRATNPAADEVRS
jgi:hypothetical protein